MNSREIVFANLSGRTDVRPGLNFCSAETHDWLYSDRAQNSFFYGRINDIVTASLDPSPVWRQRRWSSDGIEYYDDEWGNIWYRMQDGCMRGEIYTPAVERWDQLKTLRIPCYDNAQRYQGAHRRFRESGDKFKIGVVPGWVFDIGRHLRRMEVYLCDLIEHRDEVDRLSTMISDLLINVIRRFSDIGADAVLFYEDMGTQTSLLISPASWREIFKPHYIRLVGAAHGAGLKVFMHSCGQNSELLDDLIAAGIDCFQFDQPAAYDMPALAAKLKANAVALWSPLDIQRVLPTGDKALIETEARKMIRLFQGGLILKTYSDLAGIGVKPEWDLWGYEAILEHIRVGTEAV